MKIIAAILLSIFFSGIIGWKIMGSPAELNGRQIVAIALIMLFGTVYALFQLHGDADIAERLKK